MKVAIMNDEISSDLESSLELARSWGVDAIELRRMEQGRYPDVTDYWKARVPQFVKEYGLPVAAISPGLFKIDYPGAHAPFSFHRAQDIELWERETAAEQLLEYHANTLLPASIEAAQGLGAGTIIIWNFIRRGDGPAPEGAVQVLRCAAEQAGAAGLTLAIEVQDCCDYVADIMRRVDHPALAVSWTPASAYAAGEPMPFPDGYHTLRPWIRHVHFKDVQPRAPDGSGGHKWILDGAIDWAGQIAQLKQDGYEGYVSIEPHVRPNIDAVQRTLARLRSYLDDE